MKGGTVLLMMLLPWLGVRAQEEEHPLEMRQEQNVSREMERTGEERSSQQENDEQYQELAGYARRKLDLNTADAEALHGLGMLDALQVNALLKYRETLGPLVSIYELQAVPGFELPFIRAILPYVQAGSGLEPYYTFRDYLRKGKHQLELRYGRVLEAAEGYRRGEDEAVRYMGTADKVMLRYRYRFGKYASWGWVMKKDAGETWTRKGMPWLGDHLGFHLFLQRLGKIKTLALGDFTVNMGQGLIQWQGFSFGKSAAVMQVKRESEVLRPYASAGEFFFYRGAGLTWEKGKYSFTGFVSLRRLDGRLSMSADTLDGEVKEEGSFASAGYHRTPSEMALRGNIKQLTAGAVMKWRTRYGHIALNTVTQQYSHPLKKGDELYRLYALDGKNVLNISMDHAVSWRNVHWYGEAAVDGSGNPAVLQGLLAALGTRADFALLYRYEHKAYRSMYGNAFGESSVVGNENGVYMGWQLKWGSKYLVAAYADVFRSPWLKYGVSAPSQGADALLFIQWMPDKKSSVNVTYRFSSSPADVKDPLLKQRVVGNERTHHISARAALPVNDRISWRGRMQAAFGARGKIAGAVAGLGMAGGTGTGTGVCAGTGTDTDAGLNTGLHTSAGNVVESWLLFQQVQVRFGKWKFRAGHAWFDTSETEGLYLASLGFPGDQSLARFSGRGYNVHAQLLYHVSARLSLWCHLQQAGYSGRESIGSGLEKIQGDRKTNILLQMQFNW